MSPLDRLADTGNSSDYGDEDVNWACTASLPKEFKLGATDVICEGYIQTASDGFGNIH